MANGNFNGVQYLLGRYLMGVQKEGRVNPFSRAREKLLY